MMSKYKQLAERVIQDVKAERFKEGSRMPSLRDFSKQHSVSMSTAVKCYEELEQLGWLSARPQSGFFITREQAALPEPAWRHFATKISEPHARTCDWRASNCPLGIARLNLDQTTQARLKKSFRFAEHQTIRTLNHYPHRQGEPFFRDALANHFSELGFAMNQDELVVTSGCMEAVKTALMVCTQRGDVVAVNSPCFSELLDTLSLFGLKIIEIPSKKDGIDLDVLENKCQERQIDACLLSTTHMNPQGLTLSSAHKKRLSDLAATYKMPIIEDDAYFELSHLGSQPLPAAYYDHQGYILWCASFSKSLSPSIRVGWCKPGRYLGHYLKLCQGVSMTTQNALTHMLASGEYDKHLKRTRFQLMENKRQYTQYLSQRLPKLSRISRPEGGLVLWVQVPHLDGMLLSESLEQSDLDVKIGHVFTISKRYRDCFRINMGFELNEDIRRKLDILLKLVHRCLRK